MPEGPPGDHGAVVHGPQAMRTCEGLAHAAILFTIPMLQRLLIPAHLFFAYLSLHADPSSSELCPLVIGPMAKLFGPRDREAPFYDALKRT